MRLGASAASQRDPAESAEVTIAIEEAGLCDGSECGIAVPGQEGELELLAPHWHMVEKGKIAGRRTALLPDLDSNKLLIGCRQLNLGSGASENQVA